MNAGAKLNFGKAEVYWPQDDTASDKYQTLLGIKSETSAPGKALVAPTFDAKVTVDAALDILVTPEANMGLRVGGKISGGTPLVDAQLVGYVNSTLRFSAKATGTVSTTTGTASTYKYGVYLLYNIGYGAYATIKFFPNWALKPRNAFNPTPRFTIYENSGTFTGPTKRSLDVLEALPAPKLPRRGLIGDWHEAKLSSIDHIYPTSLGQAGDGQPDHNTSSSMSMQSLLGKRADSDSSLPDAPSPDFTSQLTCPPGDTAQIRLPDFRYNCDAFPNEQIDSQQGGASAGAFAFGICGNIQDWHRRGAVAYGDYVMTYDKSEKRRKARRKIVCGSGYCTKAQNGLKASLGNDDLKLSCDEFPFAGTEEGGGWLGSNNNFPTYAQKRCVPAYQNTRQGNCNKILGQIQTNVAYFEREQRGDPNAENWVQWGGGGTAESPWVIAGNLGTGGTLQRTAMYPNQIPQAFGISNAVGQRCTVDWQHLVADGKV